MGRRVVVAGLVLLLAGCSSPAPRATVTVTAAPPATTAPPTATTTPSPTASTPTAAPSATSGGSAQAGCANGRTTIPAGAVTAQVSDVDQDGRPDTEFVAEPTDADPSPSFGVRTAAGGVYTVADGLAGPGAHSGWITGFDQFPFIMAVTDDGRSANLFTFRDCRFQVVRNPQGAQFSFGLNGFSEYGTGVACNDRNGGVLLEGAQAVRRPDGRYDVRWTQIDVDQDLVARGRTAETEVRYADLAASDPRVRQAEQSRCGDTPIVRTSGR